MLLKGHLLFLGMAIDEIIFETRKADHIDARRVLASAFNGDFEASYIAALVPTAATMFPGQSTASWLFYIVSGDAHIDAADHHFHLKTMQVWEEGKLKEETRDRLVIPPGFNYNVSINRGSVLAFATTQDLQIYGQARVHPLFDKAWSGFTAKQLKFLMPFDKEVILGGHHHEYQEAYSMLSGECTFRLEDVADPSKREEVRLSAELGNHLTMKPRLAHVAKAGAKSILVGYTAQAFEGPDSAELYPKSKEEKELPQYAWFTFKI